jgi:hypothetical protein
VDTMLYDCVWLIFIYKISLRVHNSYNVNGSESKGLEIDEKKVERVKAE